MAAVIKLDTIRGASVENSAADGMLISRCAVVSNIEISAGTTDPNVLTKVLSLPSFPQLGDPYPDNGVYAKNAVLAATASNR